VRRQVAEGRDYRNRIPAGLTGPAQVTKGKGIRYEDLDLRYVEAWSSLSSWALVVATYKSCAELWRLSPVEKD
jgi:lipopolysaccharide/colanic/teichoic acid biosynthesis glycosyltransferase